MAKSFKDKIQQKAVNPTLQFISQPEPEEASTASQSAVKRKARKEADRIPDRPQRVAQARRAQPQYEEIKSRRLQLLLTPSLYEAVKTRAAEERLSVNELVNSILKATIESEA